MSSGTEAVLFNAVPLLVLAAVYLGVAVALAPAVWRDRAAAHPLDAAIALVFPSVGVSALIFAILVLYDRRPFGGHVWPSFGAVVVALLPAVLFLARWSDRASLVTGLRRAREAEERVSLRDRELEAVSAISNALARTHDSEAAGRVLLDEVSQLFGVEFAALALVDEEQEEATGLLARSGGADLEWWTEMRLDLRNEPSGIASAVFDAAPVTVYDVSNSPLVSDRLVAAVGAKSGAWIPLVSEERVLGVLVVVSVAAPRAFSSEELALMQALAAEAALALERTRSAAGLAEALERERLIAQVSRRVRSELDVDVLMHVAVEETGRALEASRCFIRLGEPGESLTLGAEWALELEPIGETAEKLPASNLAVRERRTVAIADVETSPELADSSLGGRETLLRIGTRAVLAVPVVVFDRVVGVVGVHRGEPHAWTAAEVSVAESVARELGLALHTARLLTENQRRLEQQGALLHAAQVVTSELELETVLQRLVEEVTKLLRVDAADCYLYDTARGVLRCAAVHGLDPGTVGFEFPPDRGLAGEAIAAGRAVFSDAYDELTHPVPNPAYAEFSRALVAPMMWGGEMRGVLGVGIRDGSRSFDAADSDLLEAFAGLASLALRNAESFEQQTRQARVQRGFYRVASVLGEPLSLTETLNAAAQAAAEALGGAFAAVLMPGGAGLELAGKHELPGPLADVLQDGLPASAAALAEAASDRRLLSARSVAGDGRFELEWQRLAHLAGYRSLLAIPLEGPRAMEDGLALVFFAEERIFSDDDLELARQLARAARGALERAALYESERSSRALSQQLARTGSLLAAELDPAAVLEEVVEQAPALLGADACAIRSLEGDELVVTAVSGADEELALGTRLASTAWPAGDIVQSRAPVAVPDADASDRAGESDALLAAGFRAYLGVPLFGTEGALHGVLAVYARRARAWRSEEIEALAALGGNASAALANAELYQRVALEREQSTAILANIADGIVAVGRDGQVVVWNSAAAQITGVPAEEAVGRTIEQVLQRNLESTGATPLGNRLVSIPRSGEELWLSLSEAIMRDPAGGVAGRIFAFRDISSERVVEQMKSDFVSTVSHELRTPLTSIYGFAETLLRQDVLFGDEERRTFLGYIASEAERLTGIVDSLLNVAQLDTGDLSVQLAPTDVASLVSEVVEGAEETVIANAHEFVLDIGEGPLAAAADPEKLRQILDQLIENAVKFSPAGGKVTVAARRRPDAVQVSVVDEGIGIPPADRQRIFTKFYRAADVGEAGGTGLGLFIAQGLVSAMGGKIWVESTEGEGSSFTFELPLAGGGE